MFTFHVFILKEFSQILGNKLYKEKDKFQNKFYE